MKTGIKETGNEEVGSSSQDDLIPDAKETDRSEFLDSNSHK